MNIGILAYPLSRKRKGISHYVCLSNLIKELEKIDAKNNYFLYVPCFVGLPFKNNPHWSLRICKGLINRSSTLWQLFSARRYLAQDKIDILWTIENPLITNLPKTIKTVLTIHDIRSISFINWQRLHYVVLEKLFLRSSIVKADHIVTVSFTTRKKIKELLHEDIETKSTIIYNAASDIFKPHDKEESARQISKMFNVSAKYIFTVATKNPIKNLERMIYAFTELKNKGIDEELLIVGDSSFSSNKISNILNKARVNKNCIRLLGFVSEEDLVRLYCGAELFIFTSLMEGFGLPVIEAMACGAPVICSDIHVLKEITDEAAIYVDPHDINDIADKIFGLLQDNEKRRILANKGITQAKKFSWRKSAEKLLETFEYLHKN